MRVAIAYGTGFLPVHANEPLRTKLLVPVSVSVPSNPNGLINDSVARCMQFSDIAKTMSGNSTFAVVIDSPERSRYCQQLLDTVLSNLKSIAVDPSQITIIVSSDTYRHVDFNALDELLGYPTRNGNTLTLHDPSEDSKLRDIGKTSHSVQVELNSHYADADYRIIASSVMQDVFMSATGGCASILPGLSSAKTIARNRKLAVANKTGPFSRDSKIYQNLVEAAQIVPPDVSINLVSDWQSSIAQITVGDIVTAWQSAMDTAKKIAFCKIDQKVDIAIVSAGGKPHDSTLYNSLTALMTGHSLTRQDGTIVLMTECPNGAGPEGFVNGIAMSKTERDVEIRADTEFQSGIEGARLFWKVIESRNLIICSRMKPSMVTEKLHCIPVQDSTDGLEIAIKNHGRSCNVAIVPNGSRTIFNQ